MPAAKRSSATKASVDEAAPAARRKSSRQSALKANEALKESPEPTVKAARSSNAAKPARERAGSKATKPSSRSAAQAQPKKAAAEDVAASKQKKGNSPKKRALEEDQHLQPAAGRAVKRAKHSATASKVTAKAPAGVSRDISEDPDIDTIPERNDEVARHDGEWYWLMKAEPETRLENGIDVSFSIDDLRAKKEPEPWDGIRAYPARNNLRSMNVGDKAFFYHSNCKNPGIVGTMEIVKEYSEDRGARKPGTPYYDPTATKEKNRWSVVHVRFLKKFAVPILLSELREMGQPGRELQAMQMLKQSRLSVSRVSESEWTYLCKVADDKAKEAGLKHEEA